MATIYSDTFTLIVTADTQPAGFRITGENNKIQYVTRKSTGTTYSTGFAYKLGDPRADRFQANLGGDLFVWTYNGQPAGGSTGVSVPSAEYNPDAPVQDYDHDNNSRTPNVPVPPADWQYGAINGRVAGNLALGTYVCTAGISQPT